MDDQPYLVIVHLLFQYMLKYLPRKELDKMEKSAFFTCFATIAFASLAGCGMIQNMTPPATPTSSLVVETLAQLNSWYPEDINVLECPNLYSNRIPSGETGGWVRPRKQDLRNLGVYVRWDCKTKTYEITTKDDLKSKCECQ